MKTPLNEFFKGCCWICGIDKVELSEYKLPHGKKVKLCLDCKIRMKQVERHNKVGMSWTAKMKKEASKRLRRKNEIINN